MVIKFDIIEKTFMIFEDEKEVIDFAIKQFVDICQKAIKEKNIFVVALSGGKTPIQLYQKLSNLHLSWNKIHIFSVDERYVSFNDTKSNYRMIRENLIDKIDILQKNIHPIYIEETIHISARRYEEELKRFFNLSNGEFPKFDLIILGMGEDGHIASLFPDDIAIYEKRQLAVTVQIERLKSNRISITLPVINNSKNVIFLVIGKNKALSIKEMLVDNNPKLPANLVYLEKGKILFLFDKEAAALLM